MTHFCLFCGEDVAMIHLDASDAVFIEHEDILTDKACKASGHTVAETALMFADAANEAFANLNRSITQPDDPIFNT